MEYIDLVDFSAGIESDFVSRYAVDLAESGSVLPTNELVAQEHGTVGCVALPDGGLGPLGRVRAYMQDTQFWVDGGEPEAEDWRASLIPNFYQEWEPEWANAEQPSPVRVPIIAAKVFPAHVGPARSSQEDVPATEPLSHDPIVYWHFGPDSQGTVSLDPLSPDPFQPCGEEIDVETIPSLDQFPAGPFWGIGLWARACNPTPNGEVTLSVVNDDELLFMTLDITPNVVSGRAYKGSGAEFVAIGAGGSVVTDIEEWVYYWCMMRDQNPGGTLTGTMEAGFNDTSVDIGTTDEFMESSCFGVNHWSWSYANDLCGGYSQNTKIRIHKGEDWEIFGIGVYPDGIDVPGFSDIYTSQGPVLADVVPGFVTAGTRPDLTSGDISFPAALPVTYNYYYSPGVGDYNEKMVGRFYKPYLNFAVDGPNIIEEFFDAYSETVSLQMADNLRGYSNYDFTRSRHADPAVAGPPFLVGLFSPYNADADGAERQLLAFPDPASLDTDGTFTIIDERFLFLMFTHQSRVLFLGHSTEEGADLPMGADGVLGGFERWGWTGANDIEVIDNDLTTIFVEENPFGYGCVTALNANEALLVKQMGGGVSVRGALAGSTTVVRLPGLASTQSFYNIGVHTPYGFIYGSTRGVWLWSGGDQSVLLSPNLGGRLLVASDESVDDYLGMKGSFSFIEPFVFAPNSWVFDTRTESWWKLQEHPDLTDNYPMGYPSIFYGVDTKGLVYAFPSYLAVGDPDEKGWNVFCQVYDLDKPDSRFQWTSQPLALTQSREVTFREVILHASGQGTVTITLTGVDGVESAATFTVNSTERVALRGDVALASADVVCRIRSEASDPDLPAPYVHRVRLGHQPATRVAK